MAPESTTKAVRIILPNPLYMPMSGDAASELMKLSDTLPLQSNIYDIIDTMVTMYYNDLIFMDDHFEGMLASQYGDSIFQAVADEFGFEEITPEGDAKLDRAMVLYKQVTLHAFKCWKQHIYEILESLSKTKEGPLELEEIEVDGELNPTTSSIYVKLSFS